MSLDRSRRDFGSDRLIYIGPRYEPTVGLIHLETTDARADISLEILDPKTLLLSWTNLSAKAPSMVHNMRTSIKDAMYYSTLLYN